MLSETRMENFKVHIEEELMNKLQYHIRDLFDGNIEMDCYMDCQSYLIDEYNEFYWVDCDLKELFDKLGGWGTMIIISETLKRVDNMGFDNPCIHALGLDYNDFELCPNDFIRNYTYFYISSLIRGDEDFVDIGYSMEFKRLNKIWKNYYKIKANNINFNKLFKIVDKLKVKNELDKTTLNSSIVDKIIKTLN